MKKMFRDPLFAIASIFVVLSLFLGAVSLTRVQRDGEIEVNVTYPKGIPLRNMKEGREIELSYESEYEVGVYLMTRKEAEDLRRPSFYREPKLPDSLHIGERGDITFKLEGSGDYELIFYNESFTQNVRVEYSIDTGMRIEDAYYRTSLMATAFLTAVLCVIVLVRYRLNR